MVSARAGGEGSTVTGTGPGADLQRATILLQQLRGQLTKEKPIADASTYLQLQTQVNQQLQTYLQDQLSFYQEMEQATSTYQQAGPRIHAATCRSTSPTCSNCTRR